MPGSSASSVCSRTSSRAQWTWPPGFAKPAFRLPSVGFTCRVAWRCCRSCRPTSRMPAELGVSLFAGEAEGRLVQVFADAFAGRLEPIYNHMDDLPGLQQQVTPFLPLDIVRRYGETIGAFDAGRGCPFQCSFCTIINVQGRKSRWRDADDVERLVRANLAPGRLPVFHHRRQFRAQPQLGGDLRPPDRDARARGARPAVHHPGRHALPPHPQFRREGGAGRLQAGLYRARKHQPRQSAAGQEEAEPGARVPQVVPRLARAAGDHLCRLYPRLPERHAGADRPRHQDGAGGAARRSARILYSDATARLGRPPAAL